MVRVFAAYHYGGQTVLPVDDEAGHVLASAVMDDDHLILAKSNHCIEIVSLVASRPCTPPDDSDVPMMMPAMEHMEPNADDDVNHNEGWKTPSNTLSFPTLDKVHRMLYCKQGIMSILFLISFA